MSDKQKEQIRFNIEIMKLLAVLLLGAGGGSIALVIEGIHTGKDAFFIAAGMILSVVCIRGIYNLYHETLKLIK